MLHMTSHHILYIDIHIPTLHPTLASLVFDNTSVGVNCDRPNDVIHCGLSAYISTLTEQREGRTGLKQQVVLPVQAWMVMEMRRLRGRTRSGSDIALTPALAAGPGLSSSAAPWTAPG